MRRSLLATTLLLVTSCARPALTPPWSAMAELTPESLASRAASEPSLAVATDGTVALSWVTRDSLGTDAWVSVSSDSGAHWTAPQRLNTRAGKVSSFGESRPVLAWSEGGVLHAAWAEARDTGMADDIAVRTSRDRARSFGDVTLVNRDHADPGSTYHGFMALTTLSEGSVFVAWLDGRGLAAPGEEPARAQVFAARSPDAGATWAPDTLLAREACPCCRLALASWRRADGDDDVALAYRGAHDDLRDPRLWLSHDGGRTMALDTLVAADRWKLEGCPSIGPAVSFGPNGSYVAWFTGESPADDSLPGRPAPGVYVQPWLPRFGPTGSPVAIADSLREPTHPLLATFGPATLVGVLARPASGPDRHVLAVRSLESDGSRTPWLELGAGVRTAALAADGGRHAYAAWSEGGKDAPRVRLVRLDRTR